MEKLFEFVKNYYCATTYKDTVQVEPNQSPNDDIFGVRLHTYRQPWEIISTETTEEAYVKNYGNKFANIYHQRTTVKITKENGKVSIKFYEYLRFRRVGVPYFVVKTLFSFFTYNYETNTLYDGFIKDYHKKRKFVKKLRKTPIYTSPLQLIKNKIYSYFPIHSNLSESEISENISFKDKLMDLFLKSIPGLENYENSEFSENLFFKLNLEKRGVKLPNNWNYLVFNYPQPKAKDLKKHKMKYIDALMSIHGLNGDKVKKALHKVKSMNVDNFNRMVEFFGKDFILSQKEEDIIKIFEYSSTIFYQNGIIQFSKKELTNIYQIIKLVLDGIINSLTFNDHLRFYGKIKNFEQIKWNSKTYEEFQKEHLDWTEIHGFYTKGNFERTYDNRFTQGIENPIFINGSEYYPVLLKNSTEYNLESFIQSNCVKGYISRPGSIIVSLRKGSPESTDRATIEFNISKEKELIVFKRVQTLGKFNRPLLEEWNEVIPRLDLRIDNLSHSLKNMMTPKIKVTCGYKTVEAKGIFKDKKDLPPYYINMSGNPLMDWDKNIENINSIEDYDF